MPGWFGAFLFGKRPEMGLFRPRTVRVDQLPELTFKGRRIEQNEKLTFLCKFLQKVLVIKIKYLSLYPGSVENPPPRRVPGNTMRNGKIELHYHGDQPEFQDQGFGPV